MAEQIQLGAFVAKTLNVEKQELTCVVLRPDVVDLHGDIYSADAVEKACRSFNEFCMKGNIQHAEENTDALSYVESYIAPADFMLGNGAVLKGDWVATVKVKDATLWAAVQKGEFTGLSIGCNADVEKIAEVAA
jgi:hypothetical protein